MTFYADIQNAFESELQSISGLPDLTGENKRARPDLSEHWMRGTLLRREPDDGGIGKDSQEEYGGLYQVDVFIPSGEGTSSANEYADKILQHFRKGLVINNGGTNIIIQRAWSETSSREEKWYQLPVLIRWFSYKSF